MARCKTTTCRQVTKVQSTRHRQVTKVQSMRHPEIAWMIERPSESHDIRKMAGRIPREVRSLLHTHDYHAEPLCMNKKTPLCSKDYKWEESQGSSLTVQE
jgi:hypothetical protein